MPPRRSEPLWFDVEERYNTTKDTLRTGDELLWFDVEERYNTTQAAALHLAPQLWFDVEERYNAISCGIFQRFCGYFLAIVVRTSDICIVFSLTLRSGKPW